MIDVDVAVVHWFTISIDDGGVYKGSALAKMGAGAVGRMTMEQVGMFPAGSSNAPKPAITAGGLLSAGAKPGGLKAMLNKKLGRAGNMFANAVLDAAPVEITVGDNEIAGAEEMTEEELEAAKEARREKRRMARKLRRAEQRLMVGYDHKTCKSYKLVISALIALLFRPFRVIFHPLWHENTHRLYFICLPL